MKTLIIVDQHHVQHCDLLCTHLAGPPEPVPRQVNPALFIERIKPGSEHD